MKPNEITAMATLHRYKRGHTPRIQKGLKHPTLAWNEIPFVTVCIRLCARLVVYVPAHLCMLSTFVCAQTFVYFSESTSARACVCIDLCMYV